MGKGLALKDCDSNNKPQGPALKSIVAYAGDEELWLQDYHRAWKFATENNQDSLRSLEPCDDNQRFDCGSLAKKWECRVNHQCEWADEDGVLPLGFAQEEEDDIEDFMAVQGELSQLQTKNKKWKKGADKGNCVPI